MPWGDRVAIYLFRRLTGGMTAASLPNDLFFDLDDVRAAMAEAVNDGLLAKNIKNEYDIKYAYDARRDLPAELEQCGPRTWLQVGKGRYNLARTRRKNLIILPEDLNSVPNSEIETDVTPKFIAGLLGSDEQAVFTRVRSAGIISKFLGFTAWPIQGHHRTTVSHGQIEVDEVQAGLDKSIGTIVPISGKGGHDRLSWSQARNLNTYGIEKSPIPGLYVRSLGLWRDGEGTIWIVEFTPQTHVDEIEIAHVKRFIFA